MIGKYLRMSAHELRPEHPNFLVLVCSNFLYKVNLNLEFYHTLHNENDNDHEDSYHR